MTVISTRPPWYYCFYFGTIWSIIFLVAIVVGSLVFFLVRKKKGKKWTVIKVVAIVVAIVGVLSTLASFLAFV
jgi:ABC-type Fe3+-siderophore transport system permease subunit